MCKVKQWTVGLLFFVGFGVALPGCAEAPSTSAVESAERDADHAAALAGYDALLREHVDAEGLVDYAAIVEAPGRLDAYVSFLAGVDLSSLGDDERLATLINAYNAFTLRLIADYPAVASIMDIPEDRRWKDSRWDLGGRIVSLDALEHEIIRVDFDEPRIHWAVVCAAVSCPPLRAEAYTAERLDEQLAAQEKLVHTSSTWLRFDASRDRLSLTPLYDWYGEDFGDGSEAAIVANVAPFVPGLGAGDRPTIDWLPYDWALNGQ